jgi:glycosyltransferase involved in cell wall biosynthesis
MIRPMPHLPRTFVAHIARRGRVRDVLFVSGPGGEASRYRSDHQAEQLRLRGWVVDVGYHGRLDLDRLASRYRTIVLSRVPWDTQVERLVERATETGPAILADVDDLVFDPERTHLLRWLGGADEQRLAQERETMARLRQTLEHADGVLVSTDALARQVTGVNPRVAVTYNTVSAAMVKAGTAAMRASRRDADELVLAYLSGTSTHDRDFLEAAPTVLWALERFEHVRFWAAGLLTLDARFDRFGSRVVRVPYRPARRLPRLLASVDVSLAPLEPANDFTDAKSCLKYLEAAVVGVPTVASATSDFRRAIEPGVNGFLAADDAEWRAAVEELIASAHRRREVGLAAREDVLAQHTTAARAPSLAATIEVLSGRERAT